MMNKVAVVTGANRGIGHGIVKELCRQNISIVYLTARDKLQGDKAVENLKKEGYYPIFYQLDVTDRDNVKSFAEYLKKKHDGLDILINNAGVFSNDFYVTTYEDAKRVIDINYCSLLNIQDYIFPYLRDNARILNISSDAGHISNLRNQYWIERLTRKNINVEDVNDFVQWFLDSVKKESLQAEDFVELPVVSYRVSKIAVCALTRIQQNTIGRGICINSYHPGWVRTDMTKNAGFLSIEEASKIPVNLVLDTDRSIKGKYIWFDNSEKEWADVRCDLAPRMEEFKKALEKAGYILRE